MNDSPRERRRKSRRIGELSLDIEKLARLITSEPTGYFFAPASAFAPAHIVGRSARPLASWTSCVWAQLGVAARRPRGRTTSTTLCGFGFSVQSDGSRFVFWRFRRFW